MRVLDPTLLSALLNELGMKLDHKVHEVASLGARLLLPRDDCGFVSSRVYGCRTGTRCERRWIALLIVCLAGKEYGLLSWEGSLFLTDLIRFQESTSFAHFCALLRIHSEAWPQLCSRE